MSEDTIPEVNAMGYESVGELTVGLMMGEVGMPCWVRVGQSTGRTLVTEENKRGVCEGLLLACEMQAAISAAKSERQDNDR